MTNEPNDGRRRRGLEIAATARIIKKGDAWIVPSQSLNGKYQVVREGGNYRCSCPDHELRQVKCKHAFAVEFAVRRELSEDGTVTETRALRVTYSQEWRAYNAAQTTEKDSFCKLLRDLVAGVPEPQRRRGRPPLLARDMLFTCAFKVYSTLSARRFMSDLRAAATAGLISRVPHYNSIFNYLDNPDLTDTLHGLITRSALPLKALETDFAVDSTGLGTQLFYRHYSAKYGHDQFARDYLKLHAVVGTKTNVVAAVRITDRGAHDAPLLPPLIEASAPYFDMARVSADKAYNSRRNLELVDQIGAVPFMPFRANQPPVTSSPLWNRLYHFFHLHRDEFLPMYHKRSNAESTFSAIKRKFGDFVRSKTRTAQINEALLKVLCHNIVCVIHEIHESHIHAEFSKL